MTQNIERHGSLLFYLGLWWRRYAVLHRAQYLQSCHQAKSYFQQCIKVFQEGSRPDLAAKFINALGEVLIRLEDWQELEAVAKTAVDLHQAYSDSFQNLYLEKRISLSTSHNFILIFWENCDRFTSSRENTLKLLK